MLTLWMQIIVGCVNVWARLTHAQKPMMKPVKTVTGVFCRENPLTPPNRGLLNGSLPVTEPSSDEQDEAGGAKAPGARPSERDEIFLTRAGAMGARCAPTFALSLALLLAHGAPLNDARSQFVPSPPADDPQSDERPSDTQGAPPEAQVTDNGHTPLHLASAAGDTVTAQTLIANGVDINARSANGNRPLHFAALLEHTHTLALLIGAGAEVNATDDKGFTALHHAASSGHAEMVAMLLQVGAEPTVASENGHTPLHDAAFSGHPRVARLLIDAGADINATNEEGLTPLHYAAYSGKGETAIALVEAGADPRLRNKSGKIPFDISSKALENGKAFWRLSVGLLRYREAKEASQASAAAYGNRKPQP